MVLLGVPHKGNILFSSILNTFHSIAFHSVLNFDNESWSILSWEEGAKGPEVDAATLYIYAML
jgi:hypothetical protein